MTSQVLVCLLLSDAVFSAVSCLLLLFSVYASSFPSRSCQLSRGSLMWVS